MVNKATTSLHRTSGSNMAAASREILRPSICSVPMGNLAVTPMVIRRFVFKKSVLEKIKKTQITRKAGVRYIGKVARKTSSNSFFPSFAPKQRVDVNNNNNNSNNDRVPIMSMNAVRRQASLSAPPRKGRKCNTSHAYYGERCYSSYSYKMTRRIRPLEIRGISKSSIDGLQPLPERPEEQVPLSYYGKLPATKRDSFDDSIFNGTRIASPCPLDTDRDHSRESLDSSRDQSELSDSNSWSVCTGNLTGRSSVYSWGNDDEFDRQASATVRRMFDEIDELLFEESRSQGTDPLALECKEWSTNFHHMRVVGGQLVAPLDNGTQIVYLDDIPRLGSYNRPDTAITAISLDDVKAETLASNFNGLSISGQRVQPEPPPSIHLSLNLEDEYHSHQYSHLEEEIFAADGDLEEYFANDTEYSEPSEMARDERKTKRNKQCGYPPVTPNASATDTLISETFDQLWEEVVQSLRALLLLYIKKSSREYGKAVLPPQVRHADNSSLRPFSRDSSFQTGTLSSQYGFKSYGASSQTSDTTGLNELMHIRSLSLRQRDSSTPAVPSRDEESVPPMSRDQWRPVSSNFHAPRGLHANINMHHSDHQFYGKMSAVKTLKRSGRLQPLQPMDRIKTPGLQENDVIGEIVIGTRLHTAGDHRLSINNLPAFSPQLWGAKSGTLPPIERLDTSDTLSNSSKDRTKSPKQRQTSFSKRASSAATNESRRAAHRDKISVFPDSRPNTTHTFRSETPMSDTSKRPSINDRTSNLSSTNNPTGNISDSNENSIGVLQGVSLPLGTHNQSSKTVSFEDDVEELDNLVMWGNGPPLLNQHQQKRRRTNVR